MRKFYKMEIFMLLILAAFASENGLENGSKSEERIWQSDETNPIVVKIEEAEYVKQNKISKFIGVTYNKESSKWRVKRCSKNERFYNGYYDDEETAAHASDTLGRKLMKNGAQKLQLNFPDDDTEVYPEKISKYFGVSYHEKILKWRAQRWSRIDKKIVYNGYYDNEETAARASDTLARKLMGIGEQKLKLNFTDDHTEVYPKEKKTHIGVSYSKRDSKWRVQRWSKNDKKLVYNGCYDNEETSAHVSDILARTLMDNGEQNHKLNFPDDLPNNIQKKRKRPKN